MPNYTVAWDETVPLGTESKSLGDNRIRENKVAVRERLASEHIDITGSAGDALLMHKWKVTPKSTGSPYTVLSTDHILLITTGASDYTLALPTAAGITGKPYWIKKVDAGAGTVIIDGSGAETIDGAATLVLTHQNDFAYIISDGTNWLIIATNANLDWDNVWADAVHTHASGPEGGVLGSTYKRIAQVVSTKLVTCSTGTTAIPNDDSIPQITEGDEIMTCAITPTATDSTLYIEVVAHLANNTSGGATMVVALFQDATANALAVAAEATSTTNDLASIKLSYSMAAGTLVATTFRVRVGAAANTTTWNGVNGARKYGGVLISSIKITEVLA